MYTQETSNPTSFKALQNTKNFRYPRSGSISGNLVFYDEEQSFSNQIGLLINSVVAIKQPHFEIINRLKEAKILGAVVYGSGMLSHGLLRFMEVGIPVFHVEIDAIKNACGIKLDFDTGEFTVEDCKLAYPPKVDIPSLKAPKIGSNLVTTCGESFELLFMGSTRRIIELGFSMGLNSVGLVRSEYILPSQDLIPTYMDFYSSLNDIIVDKSGTYYIRLADLGGDKTPNWLKSCPGASVPMGVRGARVYYTSLGKQILTAQISALERLKREGVNLKIIVPFITTREELIFFKDQMSDKSIPVIPAAETPGACLNASAMAGLTKELFIGGNDLLQHFYGANREVPDVGHYLDSYSKGLYLLLQSCYQECISNNITPIVCGQLPSKPNVARILMGLGYRKFILSPENLVQTYSELSTSSISQCETLAASVLKHSRTDLTEFSPPH
jgi:hypothetical protein